MDQVIVRKLDRFFIILLSLCFVITVVEHFSAITKLPWPISTDGFYYLAELNFRQKYASGLYPSNSLFFTILSFLASSFRTTPKQTFDLLVMFSAVTFAAAIGLVPKNKMVGATLSVLALNSHILFLRQYAFPRQALAFSFLALAVVVLVRLQRAIPAIGIGLLGVAIHLSTAPCALCLILTSKMPKRLLLLPVMALAGIFVWFVVSRPPLEELLRDSSQSYDLGLVHMCKVSSCKTLDWVDVGYLFIAAILCLSCLRNFARDTFLKVSFGFFFVLWNLPMWAEEGNLSLRLAVTSIWVGWMCPALFFDSYQKPSELLKGFLFCVALSTSVIRLENWGTVMDRDPAISLDPQILSDNRISLLDWLSDCDVIKAPHGAQYMLAYFLERPVYQLTTNTVEKKCSASLLENVVRMPASRCPPIGSINEFGRALQCAKLQKGWTILKHQYERPLFQ